MTGLAWEVDQQPLTRAVSASMCHVPGTLSSICCDGWCEVTSQFKTSDYLLYDPKKLWKDLEGKKKEIMLTSRGKILSVIYKLGKYEGCSLKCQCT